MSETPLIRFHRLGGPEVLKLESRSLPDLAAGEVELAVRAIGVTQGDAMFRRGTYLERPDLPSGLGTEVCGIVEKTGPGVKDFQVGDRVSSISTFSINRYPTYAERAILPTSALMLTPNGLTDDEGAAWTLAFIPTYFMLVVEAKLKVGDWVLLNAAAATTSLAALQIAKMAGARVIGLVRSPAKVPALRESGYDALLVWGDDTAEEVRELSGGGVDIILDPVLGKNAHLLARTCRHRGHIIHYGALASSDVEYSIYDLAVKFLRVSGFTIYGYSGSDHMGLARNTLAMDQAVAFVTNGVQLGKLRPHVAQKFALADAARAHTLLEQSSHIGKLVLNPD